MLQGHVRLGLEAKAGAENVDNGAALLGQGVDNRRAGGRKRSLEHVAKDAQDAVEALEVLLVTLSLPLDAGEQLSHQDKINDQRGGQKRVLADVEQRNGLVTTKENVAEVLIKSTLVVSDGGHILDDDGVVGVLALLVEDVVGLNHIINDVGLRDLLGAELLLGAQVLAIVVAEMVVAGNRGGLDTSVDEEIDEGRLHLGLTRLEVVTADVGAVPLSQLNGTGNKGVLGRTVDEGSTLKNTGDSKDGGGGDLLVAGLNGLEQVVGRVVDASDDVGVPLSVGSPEDNDLVQAVSSFEVTNVLTEMFNVLHASLGARDHVVGAVLLVGGNEVGVVDTRERDHGAHLLANKLLQGGLEDLGAVHGSSQIHLADVPASNDEVVGVSHGEEIVERDVDVPVGLGVGAKLDG